MFTQAQSISMRTSSPLGELLWEKPSTKKGVGRESNAGRLARNSELLTSSKLWNKEFGGIRMKTKTLNVLKSMLRALFFFCYESQKC